MAEIILRVTAILLLAVSVAAAQSRRSPAWLAMLLCGVLASIFAQWLRIAGAELLQTDLGNYAREFSWIRSAELVDYVSASNFEVGFTSIGWLVGRICPDERVWLFLLGMMGVLIAAAALVRLFGWFIGLATLGLYLNYTMYIAYLNVALRQGMAFSVVLMGLSFLVHRSRHASLWIGCAIILSAAVFHLSAVISWPLLSLALLRSDLSWKRQLARVFAGCGVVAIFGWLIGGAAFLDIGASRFSGYLSETAMAKYGRLSARWDIAAVLVISIMCLSLPLKVLRNNQYYFLIVSLILLTLVYLPTLGVAYNDRVAAYALLLLPSVAIKRALLVNVNVKPAVLSLVLLIFTVPTVCIMWSRI